MPFRMATTWPKRIGNAVTASCSGSWGCTFPGLVALGLALGYTPRTLTLVMIPPLALVGLGHLLRHHRRPASITVTVGLVYCSAALVVLTHGTIEAHFHFFVIIGFIALYQDWAPFLVNIVFTVISHGIGSAWQQTLIFDHAEGQEHPWLWSLIHGVAVLVACAGALLVLRVTEDTQREKDVLGRRLADSEINRRQFTSDLLTNLARRNQTLLHRQLEIINQLEESERDPDALSDLFALDHIATRVRRNAENLLVLAGEQPPRTWSEPVPLRDVLRAAIAETENLERVVFVVDEKSAVVGHTVIDLTHLLAELTENAVRFSPPDTTVTVRSRPDRARPGGRLISIEDWGLGMPAEQIEEANALLASPPDIDVGMSQRLGFHVVARLATRHGIKVGLSVTPGSGTTALVSLPPSLFAPLYPAAAASASGARPAADPRPVRRAAERPAAAAPPAVARRRGSRRVEGVDGRVDGTGAHPGHRPLAGLVGSGGRLGDARVQPHPGLRERGGPRHRRAPGERLRQRIRGSPDHRRPRPRRQRHTNGHGANGHGLPQRLRRPTATAPTATPPPRHRPPRWRRPGRQPARSTLDGTGSATDGADPVGSGAEPVDARFSGWARQTPAPSASSSARRDVDGAPRGESTAASATTRSSSAACGAPTAPRTRARNRDGGDLDPGTSTRPTASRPGRRSRRRRRAAEETRRPNPCGPARRRTRGPSSSTPHRCPRPPCRNNAPPARSTRSAACVAACPSRTSPPSSAPRSPRQHPPPPPLDGGRRRGALPLPGEPGGRTGTGGGALPTDPATTDDHH